MKLTHGSQCHACVPVCFRFVSEMDLLLRLLRPLSRNTGRDCRVFAYKEKLRLEELKRQAALEEQRRLEVCVA